MTANGVACRRITKMNHKIYFSLFLLIESSILVASGADYFVILTANDPVVQGAEVTFTAKLFTTDGRLPDGKFKYVWDDDALVPHHREIETSAPEDKWSVTYPADRYPVGLYEMQIIVKECYAWELICITVTSKRLPFNITRKLNGHINFIQNHELRIGQYVASKQLLTHQVSLNPPDEIFLNNNATSILTYWFVDCVYYGVSSNYSFNFKYDKPDSEHVIEALVVAGFEPITTPAPPTTTTTTLKPTTTTSTTPKTTTVTTTVKPKENVTSIPPSVHRRKRDTNSTTIAPSTVNIVKNNGTEPEIRVPYVCNDKFKGQPDSKKVYGYFSRKLVVKSPIDNITVTGNNWLKHGDILQLQVKCNGSPPFLYCINLYYGPHNVTNNETCSTELSTDVCDFPVLHYYSKPKEYTIAIVIKNVVTKLVSQVTVNVYKVEKHSQLSVIVVPVSFSLVAVVLIVFGIAYYIQNRRSFTVEVANFDFGQQFSDMEYKTFRERLKDSISNAFTKTPKSDSPEPTLWPPSRKYGSMT